MQAEMTQYTPALYLPRNLGRYRSYPRQVVARIPGTGYSVKKLVWAEQELDLEGSGGAFPYGKYDLAPLRGLGRLGQSDGPPEGARIPPASAAAPPSSFFDVGKTLFAGEPGSVWPSAEGLVSYAKIAAIGMFVGVPVAFILGRMSKRSMAANRRRRRWRR